MALPVSQMFLVREAASNLCRFPLSAPVLAHFLRVFSQEETVFLSFCHLFDRFKSLSISHILFLRQILTLTPSQTNLKVLLFKCYN